MAVVLCKRCNAAISVDRPTLRALPVVFRSGVAVLAKEPAIACALRLAAKHHRNAEFYNHSLKEHVG
jgi:hypothetical protein